MELKDKTLIITGASSGIGAAAALLFAAEGANVVLGARRQAELQTLADQINQSGGRAACLAGDVTEESYSESLVALATEAFGGLNGAFNNAGIMGDMGPVEQMDAANWNAVLTANLTGAFFSAKAQIPALRARGGGALVFTGSFVGFSNGGMPGMGAYAASKAGLIGLVQSLASDLAAEGIRANALLPGGTKTAMAGDDPDTHSFIAGLHPMKRMAAPVEIAQAALFLLSDRSSFVTGGPVAVDGGIAARLV
ncbi:Dehydrogenase with variable specificity [Phaeobacter piscinae]|uniref:Dehydrogenase with variable specificity n=1 Tax=Phaeobacter piscinae TaxID=1580596 RepID=A0AAN1LBH8_9RHOB|nr:SDR family oxidoreductase [Phaeobacter piscinae]ATG44565.1 Dehydrogenase with variable specificity [Phaeobacter piscinae]AUR36879.1 Dehydrogenase with variable specificity [Phaeobacter piscinae]